MISFGLHFRGRKEPLETMSDTSGLRTSLYDRHVAAGAKLVEFAGWEIFHMKGSPSDPNRIYASQSTGWFGQLIQRSDDGVVVRVRPRGHFGKVTSAKKISAKIFC